jgi:hypothetical protein
MFKNRDNVRVMEESDGYYFLTNRRNILSIMSSGLLGPSDIFAKYKNDILTRTGGYFPLFSKGFSVDLISATTDDPDTNFPVIIELDKNKLPNSCVHGLSDTGQFINDVHLHDKVGLRLFDIVLNTDMIKEVHFNSQENLEDFLSRMFDNVPVDTFNCTVSPNLFNSDSALPIEFLSEVKKIENSSIKRLAITSDKIAASIALLAENMSVESDALLLKSLTTYPYVGENDRIDEEYNFLIKIINSIVTGVAIDCDSGDCKLLSIVLNKLVDINPGDGWVSGDFLDSVYSTYKELSLSDDYGIDEWHDACKSIINAEMDVTHNIFSDEKNIIKRSILFLLLRPDYEDIVHHKNSFLSPGHAVKTLGLFLAGFKVGYERLSNEFKTTHHTIFAPLKSYIINCGLDKTPSGFYKNVEIKLLCSLGDGKYQCNYAIDNTTLKKKDINIKEYIDDIMQKMLKEGYIGTEYDISDNRVTYSFRYSNGTDRYQPIHVDFDSFGDSLTISSPCLQIQKKSHSKKVTKKVLEAICTSDYDGKAYWIYEKNKEIILKRVILIKDVEQSNIIDVIEFIAKTADEFEERLFGHDKIK